MVDEKVTNGEKRTLVSKRLCVPSKARESFKSAAKTETKRSPLATFVAARKTATESIVAGENFSGVKVRTSPRKIFIKKSGRSTLSGSGKNSSEDQQTIIIAKLLPLGIDNTFVAATAVEASKGEEKIRGLPTEAVQEKRPVFKPNTIINGDERPKYE